MNIIELDVLNVLTIQVDDDAFVKYQVLDAALIGWDNFEEKTTNAKKVLGFELLGFFDEEDNSIDAHDLSCLDWDEIYQYIADVQFERNGEV